MKGYTNEIRAKFSADALRAFAKYLAHHNVDPCESEFSKCFEYGNKTMTLHSARRAGGGFNYMLVHFHDGRDCIVSMIANNSYMIVGEDQRNEITSAREFAKLVAYGFYLTEQRIISFNKKKTRADYRTYIVCKKFNDRMTHLHYILTEYLEGKQNGKPNPNYIKDSIDFFHRMHCNA